MTDQNMKLVVENPTSTVVASYKSQSVRSDAYQSEAALEAALIEQLRAQGYQYLPISSEAQLLANLRQQMAKLNNYAFSDSEWQRFYGGCIANQRNGIREKTFLIQEDSVQTLMLDNGTSKNIRLIDKENIHNNFLQVINQYTPEGGAHKNRYDVSILVNGLPLVHIELKRRGGSLREAFNQINRYNRESFWAGCGLYEFAQIFVISNGTETKYYSNTTREAHVRDVQRHARGGRQQTSHSFEFTSFWADRDNRTIRDLVDFTATFFSRHTLLNILTRYCIFTSEKLLLVMRPYQIAATESIVQRIKTATNYRQYGTLKGGGYIWHTTGSGKTLTSFKAARLASKLDFIDKVLFVVDRKDLDYQTMKEYDRFEKGAANSNRSTEVLKQQLESPEARIIITTIQKLSTFIKKNPNHPVYRQHVVLIFDECHRSQFGDMHQQVTKNFKCWHLFGFTGTPIFPQNAVAGSSKRIFTTEQAFGDRLHIYTIVDAIHDQNVLPFKVDYVKTMRYNDDIADEQVRDIDRERAFAAPERIANVTAYILEHYAQKTLQGGRSYTFNRLTNIGAMAASRYNTVEERKETTRLTGFNSIFAVGSIPLAKLYYAEFKRQQEALPAERRLRIGLIYSYGPNDEPDDESSEDTDQLSQPDRDFLEQAIADYNALFGTRYSTDAERFQSYYKDVSLRMKNRELDLLIVVNMFLTGFDATTLNTLWVDKNLRYHGLLQAFSRTNRILNSVKTVGNIVCFRNLERATNDAIGLFGDREAGGIVIIRTFDEYYRGYLDQEGDYHPGYLELAGELLNNYPLGTDIVGEQNEKNFIKLFGTLLRSENLMKTFDQFEHETHIADGTMNDYRSIYLGLYEKYRRSQQGDVVNVNDDIEFEMELVRQVEVNIDYILYLVEQLHHDNTANTEIAVKVKNLVEAGPDLRDKKELIMAFIETLNPNDEITAKWRAYALEQRQLELERIIAEERLKPAETLVFMARCFDEGEVLETGTDIVNIMPPMNLFSPDRTSTRSRVVARLKAFFQKYYPITGKMNIVNGGYAPAEPELARAAEEGVVTLHVHGDAHLHAGGDINIDTIVQHPEQ